MNNPPESLAPLLRWPAERNRRKRIANLLGPAEGLHCLDIGGADGGLGWFLRQGGGTWNSLEFEESAQQALASLIREPVALTEDGRFPFENETFDAVVLADRLESVSDDLGLVRECHRVLKPAGRLVLHAARAKRGLLGRPVRGTAGAETQRGYTESDLFEVLKDGFDVQDVQCYGRFFSELADRIGWSVVEKSDNPARSIRLAALPVWLLSQGDLLLFFTRGHRLAVRAKRRLWIPRHRPVLRDGRSIAEATLATRIGTASPLAEAKRTDG